MAIEVIGGLDKIEIGATGLTEILQNVKTILSTPKGSVPLDREFGVANTFLDSPTPLAIARAVPDIFEAIEKYEPRAKVLEASFVNNQPIDLADGKLVPKVKLEIL